MVVLWDRYKWEFNVFLGSSAFVFAGLAMFVLNEEVFGHMPRPESYSNLTEAASEFVNWKLKTLGKHQDRYCSS